MIGILKKVHIIFLLCIFGLFSFTLSESLGKGFVKARYPLLPEYIKEENVSQPFCNINTEKTEGDPDRNVHNGIDIPVPNGNVVYSLCDGEVVWNSTSESYWNSFLIIRHTCCNGEFYAYYGHTMALT